MTGGISISGGRMKLWIVVAGAADARIFETHALNDSLKMVANLDHPRGRLRETDLVSDRPGRTSGGGIGEDSMAPSTSAKEVETEEFARHIAEFLQKQFDLRHFDALAILAPAHFLGLLREMLRPEVRKVMVFDESKDFAKLDIAQLRPHLGPAIESSFRETFARSAWE
jgi:protein required for attachment to host cells